MKRASHRPSVQPTSSRGTLANATRSDRVTINVGGRIHRPYKGTLRNIPDSPLAWILHEECRSKLDFDPENGEYFFDRHPAIFSQVLNYFQTGKLHCPRDVCGPMFEEELRFWGIQEQQMESCCWSKYTKHRETQEHLKMFHFLKPSQKEPERRCQDVSGLEQQVNCRKSKWRRYRRLLWQLIDEPYSSNAAKAFSWISLGFILLSITTYTVYTTSGVTSSKSCNGTSTGNCATPSPLDILFVFEILCLCWFTFEILVRAFLCPNKSDMLKAKWFWLDLVAIVPGYVFIIMRTSDAVFLINMLRFVRISRFFRVVSALHILGKTLQASAYQLLVLAFVILLPLVLFASIVFHTERTSTAKDKFPDVPTNFWWSIITMTTVGYGRVHPVSHLGYLVGGAAALVGVILLSLTASVLGSSFQQYYSLAQAQLKLPSKKKNRIQVSKTTLTSMTARSSNDNQTSINSGDSKYSEYDSGYCKSPGPVKRPRPQDNSFQEPPSGQRGTGGLQPVTSETKRRTSVLMIG